MVVEKSAGIVLGMLRPDTQTIAEPETRPRQRRQHTQSVVCREGKMRRLDTQL